MRKRQVKDRESLEKFCSLHGYKSEFLKIAELLSKAYYAKLEGKKIIIYCKAFKHKRKILDLAQRYDIAEVVVPCVLSEEAFCGLTAKHYIVDELI